MMIEPPGLNWWIRHNMRRRLQLLTAQLLTVVAMGWVSAGSHAIVRWVGYPDPWAWAFPVIVDLGILYVTPFQTDATLPDNEDWPIRKNAGLTRAMVWWTVAVFNVFHGVRFVQEGATVGTQRTLAYVFGVIIGLAPVVMYGRVSSLESMVVAWMHSLRHQVVAETDAQRERRELADRDRAELREREAQERADRIAAEERAAIERAADREAALKAKEIDAGVAVAASSRVTRTAPRGMAAVTSKFSEAEVNALCDRLPGRTKAEKARSLLIERWDAGEDLTGTQCARMIGCDPSLGRVAAAELRKERGMEPSDVEDTGPGLRLAAAAEG